MPLPISQPLRRRRPIPGNLAESGQAFLQILNSVPAPENRDYVPLYEAVDKLPEKLRLAVILFYFQGEDLASAAGILGIPVGTVKSRLSKARKQLKEVLSDESS